MGWREFASSVIGSLAWPVTVLLLVSIVWLKTTPETRKGLLDRLRRAGPVEFDAAQEKQASEAVTEATRPHHGSASGKTRLTIEASGNARPDGPNRGQTEQQRLREAQQLIDAAAKWGWVRAGRNVADFPHPLVTWTKDGAKIIGSRTGLSPGDTITFAAGSYTDPDTGKPNTAAATMPWTSTRDISAEDPRLSDD